MHYREIRKEELSRSLFAHFHRRQVVTDCLRREEEGWAVKPAPFVDDWSEEDYAFLVECLKGTITKGGAVFGAFLEQEQGEEVLKGFASVEGVPMGSRGQYRDLTYLHVSEDMRGRGMGRKLFFTACQRALELGGEKLYIASHPAMETQLFYRMLGCTEAKEIVKKHLEEEPNGIQLEKKLKRNGDVSEKC